MELQPNVGFTQQMQLFGSNRTDSVAADDRLALLSSLPKIVLTKINVDPKLFKLKEPLSCSDDIFNKARCAETSADIKIFRESPPERNNSMIVSLPLTKELRSWLKKKGRPPHKTKSMTGRIIRPKRTHRAILHTNLRAKSPTSTGLCENNFESKNDGEEVAKSAKELERIPSSHEQDKSKACSEGNQEEAATGECDPITVERSCNQSVANVLKTVKAYHKIIKEKKLQEHAESERERKRKFLKNSKRRLFDSSDESDEPTESVPRTEECIGDQCLTTEDATQCSPETKPSPTNTSVRGQAFPCPPAGEPEIEVVLDDREFGIVVDQPPLSDTNLFLQQWIVDSDLTDQQNGSISPKRQSCKSCKKSDEAKNSKKRSKGGIKTAVKHKVKVHSRSGKTVTRNTRIKSAGRKGTIEHQQNTLDPNSQPKKRMSGTRKGKDQDGSVQKRKRGRPKKNPPKTQHTEKKSLVSTDKSKLSLELHVAEDPAQLQSSTDSGYPTSASSYETSSLSGPNSKSPDLMTPTLISTEFETLEECHHQRGLILNNKDPILQHSNLNNSDHQVLDSTQVVTVFDPNLLQANYTIDETQGVHPSSNQDPIFPELELLLNQNVNPEHLFEPTNQIVIERVESLNGNENEAVEVCEVDDILQSETVAQCLRELQQSGKINCGLSDDTSASWQTVPADCDPLTLFSSEPHSQNEAASCSEVNNMTTDLCKPAGKRKPVLNSPRQRVIYQVDALLAAPLPMSSTGDKETPQIAKPATEKGKKRARKKRVNIQTEKEDTYSCSSVSGPPDSPRWSSQEESSDDECSNTALPLMSITKSGRKLKPSWKVVANGLPDSSPPLTESSPKSPIHDSNTSAPSTQSDTTVSPVSPVVTTPTQCNDNPVPSPHVPSIPSTLQSPAAETLPVELHVESKEQAKESSPKNETKSWCKKEKVIVVENGGKKRKVKIIRSTTRKKLHVAPSSKQLNTSDSFSDNSKACNDPSIVTSVSEVQVPQTIASSLPLKKKKVVCFSPTRGLVEVTLLDCEVKLSRCDVSGLTSKEGARPHKQEVSNKENKVTLVSSSTTADNIEAVNKKTKIVAGRKNKTLTQPPVTKIHPVVPNSDLKTQPLTHPDDEVKSKTAEITSPPATKITSSTPVKSDVTYKTLESGGTSKPKKNTVATSNSLSMSLDVILKEMGSESLNMSSQKPEKKTKESSLKPLNLGTPSSLVSDSNLLEHHLGTHSLGSHTHTSALCPLPDLDLKEVTFRDPLESTPYSCEYSISLTDQEITNLILSPLADDESSDPEINTDNLFAPPCSQEDSVQPQDTTCISPPPEEHNERSSDKLKSKWSVANRVESLCSCDIEEPRTVCIEVENSSRHDEDKDGAQESEMPDQEHVSLSPVPTKKLHLSEGAEEGGEDCIDLFPEDGDIFAQDVNEDPLAKIFPNASKIKTKTKDTNKCGVATLNNSTSGVVPMELCDTNSSLDCEVLPPVSMPYKKKQVSQWVAEQQRRVSGNFILPAPLLGHGILNYPPQRPTSSRSVSPLITSGSGVCNQTRGLLNAYGELQCTSYTKPLHGLCRPPYLLGQGATDIPPPPPPIPSPLMRTSSPVPNPFFATTLPSGPRSTHSQESTNEAVVTTPTLSTIGGLGGYCKNFIRGFCSYMPCKFKHAHRDTAPLSVVEEALFRQPVEKIPVDVVSRFVADFHSNSLLKNKFSSFVDLVRALLDRNFAQTVSLYKSLAKFGVNFSAPFLSQLLELATFQTASVQTKSLSFIEDLFATIKRVRGHHINEDYHTFLKVLVNCDAKKHALSIYDSMKLDRVEPILDTFFLMLRLGKIPDYSPILLLEDIKLCHPKPVEEARIVNRIIDTAEYPFPKDHSIILGKWLEVSSTAADKLTFECYHKLYKTFSQNQQWGYFVTLLKSCPTHLHDMRSYVCSLLMKAVERLGPTVNVIGVVEKMSEEQMSGIDIQVWNTILMECAVKGRSQKVMKFYQWLSDKKKPINTETYMALMDMYIKQHCPSACITILRDALKQSPPVIPSVNLLNQICCTLEKAKDVSDIMLIIRAQLTTNVNPPAVILNTLFSIHSKEKIHSKLAEVVKLSRECGAILDKTFYQKCLVELRQWGRDQDAISAVYKALRKVEGLEDCLTLSSPKQSDSTTTPVPKRLSSLQLPLSPSSTSINPRPLTKTTATVGDNKKTESSTSQAEDMSLEGVLQRSTAQDTSNVVDLIQVNGTQGQFGAVAAILVSLQNVNSSYDSKTIHAVWKAITSSPEGAANGFSSLVFRLDQFRSATGNAGVCKSLPACDRWLISQIGIALMRTCERNKDWQSGFVILHYLHRFGVHYVNYSQPHSSLPPLMPHPPSSCSVALMAVNICLHVNQITGALEVLRGCEWVEPSRSEELEPRTELLCSLAEKCLESKMHHDAWKCLEAVEFCTVVKKFIHIVTNLHNKLLQSVLAAMDQSDLALTIYRGMRSAKLQCLPSIFSNMLQFLCDSKQDDLARDLCKAAISDGSYCPLVQDNLFKVFLPMGLVRVELHLLLEEHLRRMASEVWKDKDKHQPLYIQFGTGCRHILEQVFAEDFSPSLKAVFAGKSASNATIPASSLQQWFNRNVVSISQESSVGETNSSTNRKSVTVVRVGQKRRLNSLSSDGTAANNVRRVGIKITEKGDTVTNEVEQPPKKMSRLNVVCKDSSDVDSIPSLQECCLPSSSALKQSLTASKKAVRKKQFKEAVCRTFVDKLKPHYQAKKFKTPDDYTHLLRTLSHNFFKHFKSLNCTMSSSTSPDTWDLKDSVRNEIASIVSGFMSQCTVYSRDLDTQLGL